MLRPITSQDIAIIKQWPSYMNGFEQMDYAVRDGGWIDEFWNRPDARIYVAELNRQIFGFSLLHMTSAGEAEFRIAIHPEKTGTGLGRQVTIETLRNGFRELNLNRIHLIVRKSNPRAERLYTSIGFRVLGESIHTIQGRRIEFRDMDMTREAFLNEHGND